MQLCITNLLTPPSMSVFAPFSDMDPALVVDEQGWRLVYITYSGLFSCWFFCHCYCFALSLLLLSGQIRIFWHLNMSMVRTISGIKAKLTNVAGKFTSSEYSHSTLYIV